jgi:hypothetical protein
VHRFWCRNPVGQSTSLLRPAQGAAAAEAARANPPFTCKPSRQQTEAPCAWAYGVPKRDGKCRDAGRPTSLHEGTCTVT